MNRSEERIPKLRTRGRNNRRKLLNEAERLLADNAEAGIRFSDVFESAGVSRGSAYRIYIGMDDLMQDLAGEWITNFVEYLRNVDFDEHPGTWQRLSDIVIVRATDYWAETSNTLRVLPRVRSSVPANYKQALSELSICIESIFNRYFEMPEVPGWHGKLNFYAQLADLSFSNSVRLHERITAEHCAEAQAMCRQYLSFHLPESIPPRLG